MLQGNYIELNYITPGGAKGCYKLLMYIGEGINTTFFAVQTQTVLKQVFEVVSWTQDAAANFAAIDNFYKDAIKAAKNSAWYLYYKKEAEERDRLIMLARRRLHSAAAMVKSSPTWDAANIIGNDKIKKNRSYY